MRKVLSRYVKSHKNIFTKLQGTTNQSSRPLTRRLIETLYVKMEDEDIFDNEWKMIGFVIAQFNELELLMTKILSKYISPASEREEFVYRQLLNNSVVSFGAKVKLLVSITKSNNIGEVDRNKLHRILSLRNAIAHNDVISKFSTHIPEDWDEDIVHYFVADRMKSDGNIETINKSELYGQFLMLHDELGKQLETIYENV